jgi:hypothetical protein
MRFLRDLVKGIWSLLGYIPMAIGHYLRNRSL